MHSYATNLLHSLFITNEKVKSLYCILFSLLSMEVITTHSNSNVHAVLNTNSTHSKLKARPKPKSTSTRKSEKNEV